MALSKGEKFNDADRDRVVNELEEILQCPFSKIGKSRTLFSDNAGNRYYVLGGKDNWHGIPKRVIDIRDNSYKEIFLIIAKMFKTRIVIFKDSIEPLIENKDKLSSSGEKYEFFIERIEQNHLRIRELPGYCPKKLGEFPYDDEMRKKQKVLFKLLKEIDKSSLEVLYQVEQAITKRKKEL